MQRLDSERAKSIQPLAIAALRIVGDSELMLSRVDDVAVTSHAEAFEQLSEEEVAVQESAESDSTLDGTWLSRQRWYLC